MTEKPYTGQGITIHMFNSTTVYDWISNILEKAIFPYKNIQINEVIIHCIKSTFY